MKPEIMKPEIIRLNLLSPLLYEPVEPMIFAYQQGDEEKLFCFELEESLAQEFQPDKMHFPGTLIFAGKAVAENSQGEAVLKLPQGAYVFCQVREILERDEIIELAVELQNEGLWQRLKLTKRFYVRYLFEDGRGVTQIWRPFT
jgi:hypothetical protein